jgi:TolB-like protein
MSLLTELRNRGVLRVAAWYAAAAWVLIQVASTVFPEFDFPTWSVRAVIVLALLGFPVALVAAWVFEITPTGIRRVHGAPEKAILTARRALWRMPSLWIALAAGALFIVGAQQAWQRLVRPSFGEGPRLAVLPFANLSPKPEDAYFADGLHEEVLATLGHVRSLRLISRTSVLGYRDATRNLKDIARELDVSLIVEGSVRRAGDDVRVTLQLIDARSDEHLWTQTYRRTFRDVLQLQELVARQIVSELGDALSLEKQPRSPPAATSVPEAYDRYLHALALWHETDAIDTAVALLTEAIALDPRFAQAYAQRARLVLSNTLGPGSNVEGVKSALADIERALELQPELPDALVARAIHLAYFELDPERALAEVQRALSIEPSNVPALHMAGAALRRLGRVDEALMYYEEALSLDPRDIPRRAIYVHHLMRYGRTQEADRILAKAVEDDPNLPAPRMARYLIRFLATGETSGWREEYERVYALGPDPQGLKNMHASVIALCTGDLQGLASIWEEHPPEVWWTESREQLLGVTYMALGDSKRARRYLEIAVTQKPEGGAAESAGQLIERAVALELLGRRAEALRIADAVIPMLPEHDAINNPTIRINRAWILIRSRARADEGYAELSKYLGSWGLQPRWIAAHPQWVLLRDDARLQQIFRAARPK